MVFPWFSHGVPIAWTLRPHQDAEHRLERRQLLLPAAELTFEVAKPALEAEAPSSDGWLKEL